MKGCLGCLGILVFSGVLVLTCTHIWRVTHPAEAAQEDARTAQIDREAAARREFLAKHAEAGHEYEICREMQREVEAQLKAPATADFPSCAWTAASHVVYKGNGKYIFSSWVDAQNSFGANIRTNYSGEALIDDEGLKEHRFRITQLNMGELAILRTTEPEPARGALPEIDVQQDIAFPAIVAKDLKGRRFAICEIVQGIVARKLNAVATAQFPSCIRDQSQVQYAEDGRYTFSSWVDIAQVRTYYDGDAVIAEEGGAPRTIRITQLNTH